MRHFLCMLIALLIVYVVITRLIYLEYVTSDATKTKVHVLNIFLSYMKDFNKSYTNNEFLRRLHNFEESLKEIAQLNELHGSTVFGLTKYSDWSADEFDAVMLSGYSVGNCQEQTKTCTHKRYQHKNYGSTKKYKNVTASTKKNGFYDIPEKFDWRKRGVVFPVLDQKFCAGCWAFSIVGVMESMSAISGRGKARLSIQELLDCSKYNNGCKKGNIQSALDFLCHGNTGEQYPIITEEEYPLKLIDETCKIHDDHKLKGRSITDYTNSCYVDHKTILKLIATHGPIVAAVNSSPWMNYIDGVIRGHCQGTWSKLNHVIQIVGYDLTAEVPYYIIRNSWGKDFGDNGYLKLAVEGNVCGITDNIAYFNVA